jgi:tetratricopeptide (TPR) repeat protein
MGLVWRGIFQRFRFLRRPQWLAVAALLLAIGIFVGIQSWAWWQLASADQALAEYQNEAALVHLQQCLRIWPHSALAHLLAARAERRAGDFLQAEQHLDQCRKNGDSDVAQAAAFEWALLRAAGGDLRSVEAALQNRVVSRPDDAPLIWEALAEGYRRTYRMPEAVRCLDRWIQVEPENKYAYFLRGELHRQVGAVGRAREEYSRVVELDPAHDEARQHLARCLVQVGRYQEAEQQLSVLLAKTPHDPELLTLLARSQYDLGKREESVQLLEEVLREHPENGPALRERGRIALTAERFADAESWYRQAVAALPNSYEVQWGLYQALQGLGKTVEAKSHLAKAQQLKDANERIQEIRTHQMTLRPFDAALHAELGEMFLQTGQREAGERWLVSALSLQPNLASAHAALARVYDERGEAAQAELHRREARRLQAAEPN